MKAVDLSTGVAGRWAAKLMAMGGVEVIRPEQRGGLPEHAAYLDGPKRSVAWSADLLEDADLVFTTFDAGERQGLARGLDLPVSCIEVTTSTFGTTGPYAALRGGPLAAWAAGGYLHITGKPDREPLIGPEFLCEYINGYEAAIGAEAALRLRQRTGEARHVDVSAMESMLLMHQTTFAMLACGLLRQRTGRYYETYPLVARPCRDGHVLIGVVTDEEFDRFTLAIGRPDLAADPRFADKDERNANRDALDAEMAEFLETHDGDAVVAILHEAGVAAAKIAGVDDALANPQLAFRDFWQREPRSGRAMPGNPLPPAQVFAGAAAVPQSSPLGRPATGRLPLEGLVVADFSVYWAGPSCTRMLAELGARVIWVERPGSRTMSDPNVSANTMDVFYFKMNRRKESLVLDLASAEGRALARELVARADVLVENNRPGVMDKLGLGASELCAAHPGLVYVSLPGYGSSGPWSQRRSYGPAIGAASGMEGRTGYPGDEPLRLGHALPDPVGGLAGALAALRGLRQRDATGRGGWFDISQLEAYVAISGEDFLAPRPIERLGNASHWGFDQGVHPCAGADEWIAIRLADDADRAAFTALTGARPGDAEAIAAFTRDKDKFAVMDLLQGAGIEAFPALRPPELASDRHLRARGFLLDIVRDGRASTVPGTAFAGFADASGRAPLFGEHSAAIRAELAALS